MEKKEVESEERMKLSFSMSWLTGEQVSLEDGAIASPPVIQADDDDDQGTVT